MHVKRGRVDPKGCLDWDLGMPPMFMAGANQREIRELPENLVGSRGEVTSVLFAVKFGYRIV